ncbi:MAG: XdhC/CoxI family protein [Hydrotalea flava]|uniref:XdhC family protein n=1 Tax=Hydrotalea sp. AMD TaxID=2501297 RepID=UPI000944EBFE|nr:XdhC/CoxI family protein [Hydrotalea sp. AMD]NIM34252.1 XdhC/CoxI family protein [Hydrotalea flava]NIM37076.1 XdhC/CoxI family protein [Hydrotalea flava]NIN02266.1 XdhC/CoxI family protein [Hydrotalea flava]NIN13921.1 XdhC/CoxI family protein [Hydrotalea flava]NIO93002.1 XdhC/CoxI family protein [Hydrotalea flava]
MKEIKDIIAAYDAACRLQQQTALATVVHVDGSSYRRPGARMLVNETGELTGAISGGCLEGDALKKALLAMHQDKKKIVVYDTTDEDDAKLGIQLGCNGIVSILFEPLRINDTNEHAPIQLLRKAVADRKPAQLICGYALEDDQHFGTTTAEFLPLSLQQQLAEPIASVIATEKSDHVMVAWEGKKHQFFIQWVQPSIQLVIVGAGNDVMPLAQIAATLGWDVVIADGRKTHATHQRFPMANRILISKPEEVAGKLQADAKTAVALMTHNYNYDLAVLSTLQSTPLPYIGLLGPVTKRNRMLHDLELQGIHYNEKQLQTIYGPTGLDLGAETAAEIALSIAAEIMSVMHQQSPIHLREKSLPIHAATI